MEACKRVDFRVDLSHLGKRRPGRVEIALEPQRPGEPKMGKPQPLVFRTRLDQQVYRRIDPVRQQLAPAQLQIVPP